jgi:hypothetical protein
MGVRLKAWEGFMSSSKRSDPLWVPLSQMLPEIFPPRVKQLGLEADHSPPSRTQVKTEWRYTSSHLIYFQSCPSPKYKCINWGKLSCHTLAIGN